MQISQLARRAGVTTKAVRYYESLGLLTPSRLANGYRDYDEHDLRLTQEIRVLNGLGAAGSRSLDTNLERSASRPPSPRCRR